MCIAPYICVDVSMDVRSQRRRRAIRLARWPFAVAQIPDARDGMVNIRSKKWRSILIVPLIVVVASYVIGLWFRAHGGPRLQIFLALGLLVLGVAFMLVARAMRLARNR